MTTFEIVAMYFGVGMLGIGGLAILFASLILVCDLLGKPLWRKLTTLHALYVLRFHLERLRKQGRIFIKTGDEQP